MPNFKLTIIKQYAGNSWLQLAEVKNLSIIMTTLFWDQRVINVLWWYSCHSFLLKSLLWCQPAAENKTLQSDGNVGFMQYISQYISILKLAGLQKIKFLMSYKN